MNSINNKIMPHKDNKMRVRATFVRCKGQPFYIKKGKRKTDNENKNKGV